MIRLISGDKVVFATDYIWKTPTDIIKDIDEATTATGGFVIWRSSNNVNTIVNPGTIKSCLIEIFSDSPEDKTLMEKMDKLRIPEEPKP